MREGIEIEEGVVTSAKVDQTERREGQTQFKVVIHEGKKRQIRRMFHAIGHDVLHLKRIGIGSLSLGRLSIGKYRLLTPPEIESFEPLTLLPSMKCRSRDSEGTPPYRVFCVGC